MMNRPYEISPVTVVQGLRQRHAEVAERLTKLDRARRSAMDDLAALERAVRVYEPTWQPEVAKQRSASSEVVKQESRVAKKRQAPSEGVNQQSAVFTRGELPALVREALREHGMLSSADVATAVALVKGFSDDGELVGAVTACLSDLRCRGVVIGERRANRRGFNWRLAPKAKEG